MNILASQPQIAEDTAERCFNCTKKVGKANLKKCSGCHLVKYCSKDCQRAAWKSHKPRCALRATFDTLKANDENAEEEYAAISKWLGCWRNTLYAHAVPAMNLPNSPPNRLATHCMLIEIERRPDPPTRALSFRMIRGEVLTRDDFTRGIMKGMRSSKEQIESWTRNSRGDPSHTLQICIIFEKHIRCIWASFTEGDLEACRAVDKQEANMVAMLWEEALKTKIDSGQA